MEPIGVMLWAAAAITVAVAMRTVVWLSDAVLVLVASTKRVMEWRQAWNDARPRPRPRRHFESEDDQEIE